MSGQRCKRWEDVLVAHWGEDWPSKIGHGPHKQGLIEFTLTCHNFCGNSKPLKLVQAVCLHKAVAGRDEILIWASRPDLMHWTDPLVDSCQVMLIGDSQLVCSWMNANYKCKTHASCVQSFHDAIFDLWQSGSIVSWTHNDNICQHLYREFNTRADALATHGVTSFGRFKTFNNWREKGRVEKLRGFFDGGFRNCVMGCGWYIQQGVINFDKSLTWVDVCEGSSRIGDSGGSSDIAEIAAFGLMLMSCVEFLINKQVEFTPHCRVVSHSPVSDKCKAALEHLISPYQSGVFRW